MSIITQNFQMCEIDIYLLPETFIAISILFLKLLTKMSEGGGGGGANRVKRVIDGLGLR